MLIPLIRSSLSTYCKHDAHTRKHYIYRWCIRHLGWIPSLMVLLTGFIDASTWQICYEAKYIRRNPPWRCIFCTAVPYQISQKFIFNTYHIIRQIWTATGRLHVLTCPSTWVYAPRRLDWVSKTMHNSWSILGFLLPDSFEASKEHKYHVQGTAVLAPFCSTGLFKAPRSYKVDVCEYDDETFCSKRNTLVDNVFDAQHSKIIVPTKVQINLCISLLQDSWQNC